MALNRTKYAFPLLVARILRRGSRANQEASQNLRRTGKNLAP
jgi:hypothetical protein